MELNTYITLLFIITLPSIFLAYRAKKRKEENLKKIIEQEVEKLNQK